MGGNTGWQQQLLEVFLKNVEERPANVFAFDAVVWRVAAVRR